MYNELLKRIDLKRKRLNLQLFAEDEGGDEGGKTDPDDDKGGDDGKPDPKDGGKDDEKKYTDADVNRLLNAKYAKMAEKFKKELQEAKDEAAKLAKMNADQKKEYEIEKLKKENEELKGQATRYELGKTATSILKENNIEATQDILDFVVGEDAETTKEQITKFVGIITAQIKAAETERATGRTPKNYSGEGHEMSDLERRIKKYRKD
jgi:hypothetical protein